jgi:simple sugar transport system permease protein
MVGFSLFILIPALASFLYVQSGVTVGLDALPVLPIPLLSEIPFLGPVLFSQNLFFYLAIAIAIAVAFLFSRTRAGLTIVAVGHDPVVSAARGVQVTRVRVIAVLVCGLLAGLAGAALIIGSVGSFSSGVVDGRGLIALAIVILGRWSIDGVVAGAALIGILDAAQLSLSPSAAIPIQLLAALPWIVVIAALVVSVRLRSNVPRNL